jgi:hypothetical protein
VLSLWMAPHRNFWVDDNPLRTSRITRPGI